MVSSDGCGGSNEYSLVVTESEDGERLDRFIANRVPQISRTEAQRLISGGLVTLGDHRSTLKASRPVAPGERFDIQIPSPEPATPLPEEIDIDVVYEDSSLLVINKERGMVVHPAPGSRSGTLVNALLSRCPDLQGIGGVMRPGIVHRLDKDTSGLMVVAKNQTAHRSLASQIRERTLLREYLALVHGEVSNERGRIDAPLGRHPIRRKEMAVVEGGRPSVTDFRVKQRLSGYTLLSCRLETGRTHQIRVHMAFIGHPLVGDPVYGRRRSLSDLRGQALHAHRISFDHPCTSERLDFTRDMPSDMKEVVDSLREKGNSISE